MRPSTPLSRMRVRRARLKRQVIAAEVGTLSCGCEVEDVS